MEFQRLRFINGFKNTQFFIMKNPKIFIGKLIQEEVFKLNISLSELSERMHISEKNLLTFFDKTNIDVHFLYQWSCVLKIDLFEIYSRNLNDEVGYIAHDTMLYRYIFKHEEIFNRV